MMAVTLAMLGIGDEWNRPLQSAVGLYGINTDDREAMFLAQMCHESQGFTRLKENVNYSAVGLLNTFGKYFPDPSDADIFAHRPERIANRVYANRMGNGDEQSGDGFKFIGRGPPQLSGRSNYFRCGSAIGVNLIEKPELLEDPLHGALAAGWFWSSNGLNEIADTLNYALITRRINGTSDPTKNGQASRDDWLKRVRKAMA